MTRTGDATQRSPGSRRGAFRIVTAALSAAATLFAVSVPAASAAGVRASAAGVRASAAGVRASGAGVPVGQALVVLLHDHVARTAPSIHAHPRATIASRRPLTGVRTVLPVLGHANSSTGRAWVKVRLPGRPNGSTGWITAAGTMPSWTQWHLSVDLRARLVTVYDRGRIAHRFSAVVGAPSTPTPQGEFFIEEGLSLSAQAAGAPFALATSARSDVLQEFDGGPGQIALHGMGNLAGALGTASSHGCIRLDAAAITWLAMHIGAGVPLSILP